MKFNLPADYNIEQVKFDAKRFTIDDFLCAHPKLLEVLLFILPVAKIFCGKVLKVVVDVLILKLKSLNCNP